ncbi:ADP compounds hydrolase NudE [Endozoicomonas elysicola]|uniref:ADP-ribose diphosphatase n=1 Tax=Endozoicomonas elysicola TaxID=305900 RepID=A0A081KH13_9GAMM|nr:ADP compounds hydrolase NudE [Endozoicomonas elysicola]KEI73439.1 ADP-ribose diphosphatase [Endozoicomonas elysicola]
MTVQSPHKNKPEIQSCREIARTRLFRVEELDIKFSNGEERIYERLGEFDTGHQGVMVVPLIDHQHFMMIREYAAGTEDYQLTLPKGLAEPGETLEEGGNRELKEEVGFGAHCWHHLGDFTLSPNYMTRSIHIMVAQNLYEETLEGDEPEPLEVETFSFDQLMELCARPDFTEARVIAALFLVREQLQAGLLRPVGDFDKP